MALRPWNVFKKTSYIVRGDVGHVPIASRIRLARAKGADSEAKQDASFAQLFAALLPPTVAVWCGLLLTRWRYSDGERLLRLEGKQGGAILVDLLAWRVLSHLGPDQVPNFVKAGLHKEPLHQMADPLLLDHERARALTRLEQLTQRRAAAVTLLSESSPSLSSSSSPGKAMPLLTIETILRDVLDARSEAGPLKRSSAHLEASMRILLDCVCALPPESREVPAWVLQHLVTANEEPWPSMAPQGEEIRATLLLLLLQCEANSKAAAGIPEVCGYLTKPGIRVKATTNWPLKAYLLSGETSDLLRRSARLVLKQSPEAFELPPRYARDAPNLQVKHDLRNIWTTLLGTVAWAVGRSWRGVFDMKAVGQMLRVGFQSAGAMVVLEGQWRLEEQLIQSEQYFNNATTMYLGSAGICLAHCVTWAWAFRFPVVFPFVFARVIKDGFMDAYRWFGD